MTDTKTMSRDKTASLLTKRAAIMTQIRELKLEASRIDESILAADPHAVAPQVIAW